MEPKCIVNEDANGDKRWYLNGKLHREDGPAIECANGHKYWFLNDINLHNNPSYIEKYFEGREEAKGVYLLMVCGGRNE